MQVFSREYQLNVNGDYMYIFRTIKDTIIALMSKRAAFGCIIKKTRFSSHSFVCAKTRFYYGTIGRNSYIGRNGYFFKTKIGGFSSIGDMCYCGLPEHEMQHVSTSPVFMSGKNRMGITYSDIPQPEYKETQIGNDVWIGSGVMIKAGVRIGNGAVVGMGSVVTHDIPPYSIAAGVPARVIGKRFSDDISEGLERIAWWDWNDEQIQDSKNEFADAAVFVSKYLPALEEKCE